MKPLTPGVPGDPLGVSLAAEEPEVIFEADSVSFLLCSFVLWKVDCSMDAVSAHLLHPDCPVLCP